MKDQEYNINLLLLVRAILGRKIALFAICIAGAAVGSAWYKLAERRYSASILFVHQKQSPDVQGLGGLGILAGGFGKSLGGEEAPVISHIKKFAKTREFAEKLKDVPYQGRPLMDRYLAEGKAAVDSFEVFFQGITGNYEIEREGDLIGFEVIDKDPDYCVFLSTTLFEAFKKDYQKTKLQVIEENLVFLDNLVQKYSEEKKEVADRLEEFMNNNQSLGSPRLQKRQSELLLDVRLTEEKYIVAVKEREVMRIKREKKEEDLVVIERPFRPNGAIYPKKILSVILPILLSLLAFIVFVAVRERRAWIYPGTPVD